MNSCHEEELESMLPIPRFARDRQHKLDTVMAIDDITGAAKLQKLEDGGYILQTDLDD
eukprot:gene7930-biopygen14422